MTQVNVNMVTIHKYDAAWQLLKFKYRKNHFKRYSHASRNQEEFDSRTLSNHIQLNYGKGSVLFNFKTDAPFSCGIILKTYLSKYVRQICNGYLSFMLSYFLIVVIFIFYLPKERKLSLYPIIFSSLEHISPQ